MELTIIGMDDDRGHAQSAKNELLASGFSRSNVQLNPDHDLSATRGPSIQSEKDATLHASIGNFFRSLFSMDDKSTYSNVYAEAVRRGSYVLTVDVANDEQRVRAEEIMGVTTVRWTSTNAQPAGSGRAGADTIRRRRSMPRRKRESSEQFLAGRKSPGITEI